MNNNRVLLLTALLMSAVVSWGQDIALMQNDDGTWRLDAMPAYDVSLQVEYEENDSIPAPADDIFLTQGTDSIWTLPAMPAYDVELVVEYEEEDIPVNPDDILLTDNDDGTWTLAAMPPFDVELMVEYEDALSVRIRHQTQFDNSPLFSIHKCIAMLIINIRRYLSFIQLDAHVRDGEPAYVLHQIDVNDETT